MGFTVGTTVEVLRVRVLRGALGAVAVDLDAVDLRGINSLLRVYPIIIPIKKPLSGVEWTVWELVYLETNFTN